MQHFTDRLASAVRTKATPLCVGLDPRWESLPTSIQHRHAGNVAAAYEEFCFRVLDIVAPLVPVVKPQSAFFEAAGPAGMTALQLILRKAKQMGLVTILDAKRGDIASTATAYAEAAFGVLDADALTVSPYLGGDALEPFLQVARKDGRGLFVLVRTSNPGGGQFQNLDCGGKPLFLHVAEEVRRLALQNVGRCGYGDVGAVVGATQPAELAFLRKELPQLWFLVPGFGAQGGTASDVAAAFRTDGLGAIVNSSRGITFPFLPDDPEWEPAIESATRNAIQLLSNPPVKPIPIDKH